MVCKTYPLGELKEYKYVVILSEYDGRILKREQHGKRRADISKPRKHRLKQQKGNYTKNPGLYSMRLHHSAITGREMKKQKKEQVESFLPQKSQNWVQYRKAKCRK